MRRSHADAAGLAQLSESLFVSSRKRVITVTWLNHWSVQQLINHGVTLEEFDMIGIDGLLMRRWLTPAVERTSADLLLPVVLGSWRDLRVMIVGGRPETLPSAIESICGMMKGENGRLVAATPGYGSGIEESSLRRLIQSARPNLVVVSMGPVMQERYAVEMAKCLPHGIVFTSGGWLEQLAFPAYYPTWAYTFRVNWAIRVLREPRRLWFRYTLGAANFLLKRRSIALWLKPVRGRLMP